MASTLESTAKEFLNEPPWSRVFKNSFDVIKDGLNKLLVAVAAVALSVRFLVNLAAGELLCIVVNLDSNDPNVSFNSLAGPAHATLAAYAAQDPNCTSAVFHSNTDGGQSFMQYGPIYIMVEAIILIMLEKLTMLFPRLSQKLERFYKSVVEEALLGKDPDVAEDFTGTAISTEKVLRERQREEICGALRNSSIFYRLYVGKNLMTVTLGLIFIVVNCALASGAEDKLGSCKIQMAELGVVTMQCRQKRFNFYITILDAFNWCLGFHIATGCISVVWSLKLFGWRRITSLMAALRRRDKSTHLIEAKGEDFLFLFDLVAHTCGPPATLRVLSFTAPTFASLCQPELETLTMTETSLKITWKRAPLQSLTGIKQLDVQRYITTIFPCNDNNSQRTIRANQDSHEVEFVDLAGGRKEYVVTLSAIIEDAKMKGVKRVTYLPPYPPQKLVATNNESGGVKISWARPKGEFEKFILKVALLEARKLSTAKSSFSPMRLATSFKELRKEREPDEVWLASEDVEYTTSSLRPGERYRLELRSMTGTQTCIEEKVPTTVLVTRPLPPRNVTAETELQEVKLTWAAPEGEGHSFLEGYKIQLREASGKLVKEVVQSKNSRGVNLTQLNPATEFVVSVATFCLEDDNRGREAEQVPSNFLESISDLVEVSVVTLPPPPSSLRLEASYATSLKVKWEPPALPPTVKVTFRAKVEAKNQLVRNKMVEESKEVEAAVYTFSHLPDILGTGEMYKVTIETVVTISGKKYSSTAITEQFCTKPLPPEKLVVLDPANQLFSWQRSPSPSVTRYKLKIRRGDEKATDFIVEDNKRESGNIQYRIPLDLELGSEYKVNIYSQVVNDAGAEVESEPLFMKVTKSEDEEEDSLENDPTDVFDAKESHRKERRTTINLYRTKTHGHGDNIRHPSPNLQQGILSPTRVNEEVPLTPAIIKQVLRWTENNQDKQPKRENTAFSETAQTWMAENGK